jgi:hypothetical protein
MQFSFACGHSLIAHIVITSAQLSLVKHDDHNNENKQQELLLASSSFSKLKPADHAAIRSEVRHEPNKIRNDIDDNVMDDVMDDVKDNKKKKDNPTTGTAASNSGYKEECVPPITVSEISKFDGGHIPLSSCSSSSSKKQICINPNNNNNKHGVCTDINDVPAAFWDSSNPIASADIPGSYWEDNVSTSDVNTDAVLEDYLSKTHVIDDSSAYPLSKHVYYHTVVEEGGGEGSYQQQNNYYVNHYDVGKNFYCATYSYCITSSIDGSSTSTGGISDHSMF